MIKLINIIMIGLVYTMICSNVISQTIIDKTQIGFSLDTITTWSIQTPLLHCKGIPDSVYQMINLKRLYIQGQDCDIQLDNQGIDLYPECCFLREISPKIKNLKKLEELNLLLNGLDSLPKEIAECQNLKTVDLTDGTIENIDILIKIKKLEYLYVFGCHLTKLPKDIGELTNLKELGLTGNSIDKDEIIRIKKELPKCRILYDR